MSRADTVLVLRALGLGDLLTAAPALRGLRRGFPHSRLVLAAPEPLAPLRELIGVVDALWPTAGLSSFEWTATAPEVAVNLHGSGPESIEALRSSAAPLIMSHAHSSFSDIEGPRWIHEQHERRRWCRLLEYYGIDADPEEYRLPGPARSSPVPAAVVVHPGASHRARQWPEERFARLAAAFAGRGYPVVITGAAWERPLATRVAVAAGLSADRVLAGRTDLVQLAAVVAGARLVVCGDTGMAHLATAFATPSVVLFGPVPPRHWGPPDLPRHAALWAGEVGDTFAERPNPGLLRLSTPDVLEAADAVLEHTGTTAPTGSA